MSNVRACFSVQAKPDEMLEPVMRQVFIIRHYLHVVDDALVKPFTAPNGKIGEKPAAGSANWFATVSDIPLADLIFEVWLYQLGWDKAKPHEMVEVRVPHIQSRAPFR